MMKSLIGKTVVITGSAANIGKATALLFAEHGANVVVNAQNNVTGGLGVVTEIVKHGGKATFVQADLSDPHQVEKLFAETLQTFGTIDVLINNAGRGCSKPFLEQDYDDWLKAFNDNLFSTVLCSRQAAKVMLNKKAGVIINCSSAVGADYAGNERTMMYSAAKAAVNSFTKTLAKELAPHIRVNAVAPGFVLTPNYDHWPQSRKDKVITATYIDRWLRPEEIADAFLFLATSDGTTGQVLTVDGGYSLKSPW